MSRDPPSEYPRAKVLADDNTATLPRNIHVAPRGGAAAQPLGISTRRPAAGPRPTLDDGTLWHLEGDLVPARAVASPGGPPNSARTSAGDKGRPATSSKAGPTAVRRRRFGAVRSAA